MEFSEIKSMLEAKFPAAVSKEHLESSPSMLYIESNAIHAVCEFLHADERLYFDSLPCLTGLDNGPDAGTMEVIYHLYSIPFDLHLALGVELDRKEPTIESVTDIWKGANWHEREAYDLLGITFKNHPDLRRILLPDDWEGHPLRKDYQEQETYHDIKVKY